MACPFLGMYACSRQLWSRITLGVTTALVAVAVFAAPPTTRPTPPTPPQKPPTVGTLTIARPVAPSSTTFMWQSLQEHFVSTSGKACTGRVVLAVSPSAVCYTNQRNELLCNGTIYQKTYSGFSQTGLTNIDQILLHRDPAPTNAACVRRTDGTMWCMGDAGRVGADSPEFAPWPGDPNGQSNISRIGTGTWDQLCAMKSDGQILCQGVDYGNPAIPVGTGTKFWVNVGGNVLINDPSVDRASNGYTACTVFNGNLTCNGRQFNSGIAPMVDGGMRATFNAVTQTDARSSYCGLDASGAVLCYNQSMDGVDTTSRLFADKTALNLASHIYTRNVCAAMNDGSLWCATEPGTETMVQPAGSVSTTCTAR